MEVAVAVPGTTQVEVNSLGAAGAAIEQSRDKLVDIQRRLRNQLVPILGVPGDERAVGWKGRAQVMFARLYPEYEAQLQRLHDSLQQLGEQVKKSSRDYDESEDYTTQMVSSIDLGGAVGSALTTTRV